MPKHARVATGAAQAAPAHPPVHELFRDYAPFVYRVLRRLGVGEAEVEDVCQEVFLVVHQRLPEFEGRSHLRTWIYAIAIRRAAAHSRRAFRRHERVVATPPERASASDPAAVLEQRRARELLDSLLAALDEDKRQVFVLYELEELSMREVAEIMEYPLQVAYRRLHAARRDLRRIAAERRVTP